MSLKGDFKKLAKIISQVEKVKGGHFVEKSARSMGKVSLSLAQEGASSGRAPTGRAWKPLKGGGRALPGITSTLSLNVSKTGFQIQSSSSTAFIHNAGASRRGTKWRLPVRRILPKSAIPKLWAEPIDRAVRDVWLELWGAG